jgi:phosphoribosylpyrophosphate synthetase
VNASGKIPTRLVKLVSGNAHRALAEQLAVALDLKPVTAEVGSFADGETRAVIGQDVRGATVLIVQPTCPPVKDHLMVLALLSDAASAAGAARVVGIVPYFGYARQEQRPRSGDPRSAKSWVLKPGSELASAPDMDIPHCLAGAGEALAVIRESHGKWRRETGS